MSASTLEEEYRALRGGAGALFLPSDVLAVRGPDAMEYLQGQCSQDVASLVDGAAVDALVLSPQGKIDALVRVFRRSAQEFVLDVDGGFGETLQARLERFRLRVKVEIEPLTWRCIALRGPDASRVLDAAGPRAEDELAVPVAWGGVVGVDLLGPEPSVPTQALPCSAAAWEAVRIEAGIPSMGADIDERTIPAEAGLVERCVSFTKGCYTGQELVARLDARGSNVARRLVGLVVGGPDEPPDPATIVGMTLRTDGAPSGVVTSAAWSPGLGAVIGLGYLHRRVPAGAGVEVAARVDAVGATGDGDAAGHHLVAQVRELPLR